MFIYRRKIIYQYPSKIKHTEHDTDTFLLGWRDTNRHNSNLYNASLFMVWTHIYSSGNGCVWLCLPWWRHQMEIFSALLAICAGNSPVTGEFPTQRPVTRSFDVYFDLRPNERLSKQWWGWWFETLSRSLWRHRNVLNRGCPAKRALSAMRKHGR